MNRLVPMNTLSSKLLRILICVDALLIAGVEIFCVHLYNLSIRAAVISGLISFAAIVILMVCCLRWIYAKEQSP